MSVIEDLLTHYQHVIESLDVRTGSKGIFDVTVDDVMIYSKHDTGRHAEPGEVLARFTDYLGPAVPRYHDAD